MGRIEETLEDAEEALGINDRYPQAHRIRGECLMKMGDYSNAVESLEISLALDEHDLETQCLLKLAKKQESSQLIGPCVSNSSINEEGAAPNVAAAANRRTTVKNNPNKRWWCVKEDIIQDKSEQLTDDDDKEKIMKGYRVRADGSKTSYFTHEMTNEEKRLAGEFKPKEISAEDAKRLASKAQQEENKTGGSWWAGGTWEEIKHEKWIRKEVSKSLMNLTIPVEEERNCILFIESVDNWDGGGYIMVKSGVKKYIIDLSFKVSWLTDPEGASDKVVMGTLEYNEVTNCELEDGIVNPKINIRTPLKDNEREVYLKAVSALKDAIQEQLHKVLSEFKKF
eukprot:jgi/Bigna1/91531/estExt_fgenesh1_pg.C_1040047